MSGGTIIDVVSAQLTAAQLDLAAPATTAALQQAVAAVPGGLGEVVVVLDWCLDPTALAAAATAVHAPVSQLHVFDSLSVPALHAQDTPEGVMIGGLRGVLQWEAARQAVTAFAPLLECSNERVVQAANNIGVGLCMR
jgi:hypothetical protein